MKINGLELSRPMREALVSPDVSGRVSGHGATLWALERKGLVFPPYEGYGPVITPAGAAARREIVEKAEAKLRKLGWESSWEKIGGVSVPREFWRHPSYPPPHAMPGRSRFAAMHEAGIHY